MLNTGGAERIETRICYESDGKVPAKGDGSFRYFEAEGMGDRK